MNSNLLLSLLIRGDRVSIVDGRLQLQSASGRPVPDAWLKSHRDQIVFEAITALNVQAFRFHKHTTGKYQNMAGGLTTHFIDLSTDEEAFCIFNASISRARTTSHGEKGSPLPTGHFRPGKRSEFIKFWDRSGLPYPRDFSSFHERMNKLKQIIFTGTYRDQKKLEKYSVTPLTLRYDELLKVSGIQLDSVKTSGIFRENFGNSSGRNFGKDSSQPLLQQGLQANKSTGYEKYGNKVIRKKGIKSTSLQNTDSKPIEQQTVDEWLQNYIESA